jgi:hypothetical protein
MRLVDYQRGSGSDLQLSFDTSFKHISIRKCEYKSINPKEKICPLDVDTVELSFSKQKNRVYIHVDTDSTLVMLFITAVDRKDTQFAFILPNLSTVSNANVQEPLAGLAMLLKQQITHEPEQQMTHEIDCKLKNENVFARVIRKKS